MEKFVLAKDSLQGGRKENQDWLGVENTKFGLLVVVCDGMGGARGGATASKLAVRTIIECVLNSELLKIDEVLVEAIKMANRAVYQKGMSNPELNGMGTTVVALVLDDDKATAAHVGDSRIYQIRDSRKVFRTFDHSMVFELVRRGTITEEQARLSAESNVILKALGTKPDVEPEINCNLPYLKKDRFLLCTDGICGAVEEKKLLKLITHDQSVEKTIQNMVKIVDQIGNDNGGRHDNLTAILVEVNTNSKIKPKMDKKPKLIIIILSLLLLLSLAINGLQHFEKWPFSKEKVTVQHDNFEPSDPTDENTHNDEPISSDSE